MPHPPAEFDIHVWKSNFDASRTSAAALSKLLTPDETERANRFLLEEHQFRFAICRATVRRILATYLELDAGKLVFEYRERGKPFLSEKCGSADIDFNVSHSGDMLLVAVARGRRVGVDVEQIRHNVECLSIARRFFSTSECAEIESLAPRRQIEAFFACWTRKEAYLKGIGIGLSDSLDQFDVSVNPGQPAALLNHRIDPMECQRWKLETLNLGAGYAGVVAFDGGPGTVIQRDWNASGG